MPARRRALLVLGSVLVVAGVILVTLGVLPANTPTETAERGKDQLYCAAGWANGSTIIVGPAGEVLLIRGNGSGARVYETSIAWLEANGIPVNETGYSLLASAEAIRVIEDGEPPAVVRLVVSVEEGYKFLLPRGSPPSCLRPVIDWLMLGEPATARFLGYEHLPPAPGWRYAGQSLPVWSIDGVRAWVDPALGAVVAYDAGGGVVPVIVWAGEAG